MPARERLLDSKEVAEVLGLSVNQVRLLLLRGSIKAGKVGSRWRVRESVLNRYVQERCGK